MQNTHTRRFYALTAEILIIGSSRSSFTFMKDVSCDIALSFPNLEMSSIVRKRLNRKSPFLSFQVVYKTAMGILESCVLCVVLRVMLFDETYCESTMSLLTCMFIP